MKVLGRLYEIESAVKNYVKKFPLVGGWEAFLAGIYADMQNREEALKIFESMAVDDFKKLQRDGSYSVVLTILIDVCHFLGDKLRAQTLYQLLKPFEEYALVTGRCPVCGGSVARPLGVAASIIPLWAEAEQHFENAVEMCNRMGAKPSLVLTLRHYARMLIERRQHGDREKAIKLLEQALSISQDLGMEQIVKAIQTLIAKT
jgi:tetratricopeptide (TPR) repeat protein